MKILIIYDWTLKTSRNTVGEYLTSFYKYSGGECYYLNTAYGIPGYIAKMDFNLVIYHWSFFDPNIKLNELDRVQIQSKYQALKNLKGYKIALPQDDYRSSEKMCDFFKDFDIKAVFTPVPQSLWHTIYPPDRSGLEHYYTVLTGYIDEETADRVGAFYKPHKSRQIDIGYRGSSPPYWLGRAGLMKWQLTEKFLKSTVQHQLKLDLSNDARDIFYGDDWFRFLSNCRVVPGCEGGATLHDPDGSIRKKVDSYILQHKEATFEEVEKACFPGLDGKLNYLVLSPRSFDACMTRTCQALIEGEYGGILKPGVHYIEIKKDWSNLSDVMKQVKDVEYCEKLAENAYHDVVESGLYTYRSFVDFIMQQVKTKNPAITNNVDSDRSLLKLLTRREKRPWLYAPATFTVGRFKELVYRLLLKFKLYRAYKKTEYWLKSPKNRDDK